MVEELLQLLVGIVDAECSKLLTSKISKPAISRTPIKLLLLVGRSRALLMRSTSQPNAFSYKNLLSAAISSET